jgi:hypothetical protein
LLVVVLPLTFLAAGCAAAFPKNQLPLVHQLPDKTGFTAKPSVFLDVRFSVDLSGGSSPPVRNDVASAKFKQMVEEVTKVSRLFSRYTFDPGQSKDMDYTIEIEMVNSGSAGAAAAAGFVSGLSLGVIPAGATDHYKLTGKVKDQNDKELASYILEDAVTTWIGMWAIPSGGSPPAQVVPSVLDNMLRNLYQKILSDQVLRYSLWGTRDTLNTWVWEGAKSLST